MGQMELERPVEHITAGECEMQSERTILLRLLPTSATSVLCALVFKCLEIHILLCIYCQFIGVFNLCSISSSRAADYGTLEVAVIDCELKDRDIRDREEWERRKLVRHPWLQRVGWRGCTYIICMLRRNATGLPKKPRNARKGFLNALIPDKRESGQSDLLKRKRLRPPRN